MSRTLRFTGNMAWPLENGQQTANLPLSMSLVYTSCLHIEKLYSAAVTDEEIVLPMTSAKFLVLQATTNDIRVKINTSTNITIKAGDGFVLIWNPEGTVTSLLVTVGEVPASLKGYIFA